ncbi:hypothetical protein BpHYR1_011751 [Brachionus plicatilis]|uniref:Uncharacterized protein n=1 Tax=Brachionus plicatilis TaxID=10195 RepID=A0A3M7P8D5_BRAPC|nr:hypothetical protein BpHYR1_011751 [Brachionus plicatilis]
MKLGDIIDTSFIKVRIKTLKNVRANLELKKVESLVNERFFKIKFVDSESPCESLKLLSKM